MDRPVLPDDVVRDLTVVSRWKSLAMAVFLHAVILGVMTLGYVAWHSPWWPLAFVAIVVTAGLQHHLLIIAHDGSHGLVHPSLAWNDLIVDVFCAVPFGSILRFYRVYHLLHHKHQGTDQDTEVHYYRSQIFDDCRRGLVPYWKLFLVDWLGGAMVTTGVFYLRLVGKWVKAGEAARFGLREVALILLVWGPVTAAVVHFGVWRELLLFWFGPFLVAIPIFKTRGYGEHTLYEGPDEYLRTWTHQLNPIEHFFFFPLNIGYHLEHHLFPRVPWYNLRKLRRALLEHVPEYAARSEPVTVRSYFLDRKSMLRRMIRGETGNPGPMVASPQK
jgi:fatty acid desaturase